MSQSSNASRAAACEGLPGMSSSNEAASSILPFRSACIREPFADRDRSSAMVNADNEQRFVHYLY